MKKNKCVSIVLPYCINETRNLFVCATITTMLCLHTYQICEHYLYLHFTEGLEPSDTDEDVGKGYFKRDNTV